MPPPPCCELLVLVLLCVWCGWWRPGAEAWSMAGYGGQQQQATTPTPTVFYGGQYSGSCPQDGYYYNDDYSFVQCVHNIAYLQPCAPGSRNRGVDAMQAGQFFTQAPMCDINLVDFGYAAFHASRNPQTNNGQTQSMQTYNSPSVQTYQPPPQPPQQTYNPPQQTYNPPQQTYNPPQQTYNPPQQTYNPPQQTYNPPQQTYNPPQQTYNPPQQTYNPPQQTQQMYKPPQQPYASPMQSYSPPAKSTSYSGQTKRTGNYKKYPSKLPYNPKLGKSDISRLLDYAGVLYGYQPAKQRNSKYNFRLIK